MAQRGIRCPTSQGRIAPLATVLDWAKFRPSSYSFTDEELDTLEDDPKAMLELWVERNGERIDRARKSVFFAAAARNVLMDEAVMPSEAEED